MLNQYGVPAQNTLTSMQDHSFAATVPPAGTYRAPQSGSASGFGAAALVVMVFVVIAVMFATIPRNQFFSNMYPAETGTVDAVVVVPAVGVVTTTP